MRDRKRQRENRRIYKGISTKNPEGYTDMTAYEAVKNVMKEGAKKDAKKA